MRKGQSWVSTWWRWIRFIFERRAASACEHSDIDIQYFSSIFEYSNDAILLMDPMRDKILDVNPSACRMLGYSNEELLATPISVVHAQDVSKLQAFVQSVFEQGHGWTDEITCTTSADEVLLAEISAAIVDIEGRHCIISIVRDITERKQAEEALRESEERLAGILVLNIDAVISVDEAQRISLFNQGAEEIFGYRAEEVIGKPLDILLPPRSVEAHREYFASFTASPETVKRMDERGRPILGRRKDGTEFPVEASISKLEVRGEKVFTVILRDITKRKQAEEALQEANQALQALIQASPLPIVALDQDGKVRMWNPAAEGTFGWSEQEVLGRPTPIVPGEKEDEFRANLRRALRGELLHGLEARRQRKDGSPIDIGLWAAPLQDANGDASGVMYVATDLTERKQAEEALRESEERFRRLVEYAADAFFVVNAEGKLVDVNRRACDSLGYTREELLTLSVPDISIEMDGALFAEVWKQAEPGVPITIEGTHRRKDGTTFPVEVRVAVVELAGRRHLFNLVRDMTEHEQTEEMIRQQMQEVAVLEERNRIARELHDTLVQAFTGIVIQLETTEWALEEKPREVTTHLTKAKNLARESLRDARQSVWNLLPQALEERSLDDALQEQVHLFSAAGPEEVSFSISGKSRVLPHDAQAALFRICQESLTNARRHASATEMRVTLSYNAKAVRLRVQDNGAGLDFDARKAEGSRRGFGLTGMEQRAHLLGGALTVTSQEGEGTVVEVSIPTPPP